MRCLNVRMCPVEGRFHCSLSPACEAKRLGTLRYIDATETRREEEEEREERP